MMSLEDNIQGHPPAYDDEPSKELWEPTILVLAGTTIHAESADTAPLYRLSRAVAHITVATKEVEFKRVERTVNTKADEPVIVPRSRHIYTLFCLGKGNGWVLPRVFIKSESRRTMGHLGIKRSHLFVNRDLTVIPIDLSNNRPTLPSEMGPPFLIQRGKDGKDVWKDRDGKVLAVEDWSDKSHKLIITTSLHRETIDALVALWCGRIWQNSEENAEPLYKGLDAGMSLLSQGIAFATDMP